MADIELDAGPFRVKSVDNLQKVPAGTAHEKPRMVLVGGCNVVCFIDDLKLGKLFSGMFNCFESFNSFLVFEPSWPVKPDAQFAGVESESASKWSGPQIARPVISNASRK